jgi:biopolymer transport protein TolR
MSPPIGPGGFRKHRRGGRRVKPMSDINVTPFVDVMLVLLIVFMVSAPLLTSGVPVDLPEAQAKPLAIEKEPITITVDPEGRIFLKESEIEIDSLVERLSAVATEGTDERIYVRGDKTADYGTVMKVMARVSAAGFRNLGLVTLQEQDTQ